MGERYPFPDSHAPIGSDPYYAIRFSPPASHSSLALLNAILTEVADIPVTCSDAGLARHKLNWWRDELQSSWRATANHPLTIALNSQLQQQPLPIAPLLTMLSAVEREIAAQPLAGETALDDHCQQMQGARAHYFTQLCGGTDGQLQTARRLASYIHFVGLLSNLGRDLRQGRCPLPLDLPLQSALEPRYQEALQRQLAALAAPRQRHYRQLLQSLEPGSQQALAPILCLSALADSLLSEIDREGYRVAAHRTHLTPLRKSWIAWRNRRRWQ